VAEPGAEPPTPPPASPGCGPIRVSGVRHGADGRLLLCIDRLEIASGGVSVILGPNGAGKSLLLRILHGMIRPDEGRVSFGEGPPCRQGMVFQNPVLLRRSTAANISYALRVQGCPRHRRRLRLRELLELGGLAGQARQPARTLSGGERQRLAMLRALAAEPEVLFLDEPTSSLDPAAAQALERLIRRVAGGGTKVVMVTHDLGLASRLGEEVIFLHRGRVREQSAAAAFFAAPRSTEARAFLALNQVRR